MRGGIQKLLTILKMELMLFHLLAFAYNHLDPELLAFRGCLRVTILCLYLITLLHLGSAHRRVMP